MQRCNIVNNIKTFQYFQCPEVVHKETGRSAFWENMVSLSAASLSTRSSVELQLFLRVLEVNIHHNYCECEHCRLSFGSTASYLLYSGCHLARYFDQMEETSNPETFAEGYLQDLKRGSTHKANGLRTVVEKRWKEEELWVTRKGASGAKKELKFARKRVLRTHSEV